MAGILFLGVLGLFIIAAVVVCILLLIYNLRVRQRLGGQIRRDTRPEEKQLSGAEQATVLATVLVEGEGQREPEKELPRAEEGFVSSEEATSKPGRKRAKAAAEERRCEAEKPISVKRATGKRRREPEKRGGRSRGPSISGTITGYRRLRPEIVCWKRERRWVLGVEVPDELFGCPSLEVLQNGLTLSLDESWDSFFHLRQVSGRVVFQWKEGRDVQSSEFTFGEEGYLLFKLSSRNQDHGRHVKNVCFGSYLVIAPLDWERDERLSGPPPCEPEPVSVEKYCAHFFDLEREGGYRKIALLRPGQDKLVIEPKMPRFGLVGNRLDDANEDMGPLFGGGPPQLSDSDEQMWKDIGTIVVGEEGKGRGRWRVSFSPTPGKREQNLPQEIAERKGGWYFIRFYDENDNLLESLDFRFTSALREIKVYQPSPLPTEGGHKPVCVELLCEPGCIVEPVEYMDIQPKPYGSATILTIPPSPKYDLTRWSVGYEDVPRVRIDILVKRVWWAVHKECNQPPESEWRDQPLTLSRDEFAATSEKALWLRLPRPRWVDRVLVGFERRKARDYPVSVTKDEIVIPLREFGDAQEIQNVGVTPLKIWIRTQDKTDYEATCCEIRVKLWCRFCTFEATAEGDMHSHISSSHLGSFLRPLTYGELSDRIPSLPVKIYQCCYCDHYVCSDDLTNPTSAICHHIERECPKAPRGIEGIYVRFKVITDLDEIRRRVIRDLPLIYQCEWCKKELENPTENDKINHLISAHKDKLCYVR